MTTQTQRQMQAPATPREYVERIAQLVAAGEDEQALEFSARFHEAIEPHLSLADLQRVDGLLEGAAMAVSLRRSVDVPGSAAAPQPAWRRRTAAQR